MDDMLHEIADKFETGRTGIFHIKRLWSKLLLQNNLNETISGEAVSDEVVMDLLGIGYLPTHQFVYSQKPSFEAFEDWIIGINGGTISPSVVEQCNYFIKEKKIIPPANNLYPAVLSETDLKHWEAFGYVIVRNAISIEDCTATRELIWHHLGMEENNPASWYQQHASIQGIMVSLYHHPQINQNRHSPRIRKAFEQIWGTNQLVVTADKLGFNPPETATYTYRGTGLHWDVSLTTPIPFGTQGILYLTDTTINQGPLTLIPAFHQKIDNWLKSIDSAKNPRDEVANLTGARPIAANAGDFIIWHHCLPHGGSPNTAAKPRLVQYMNYYNPFVERSLEWK